MPFSRDLKQTLKTTLMLTAALPLIACIESDEDSEVAVSGELNTINLAASVELASAGLEVALETSEEFEDSVSSNSAGQTSNSNNDGITGRNGINIDCDLGGTANISFNDNALSFSYDNCRGQDQELVNGAFSGATTKGNIFDLALSEYSVAFNIDYQEFSITSSTDQVFSFDGTIDLEMDLTPTTWMLGMYTDLFQYQVPEKSFTLEQFEFEVTGTVTGGEPNEDGSWNYDYFITNEDGTFHVKSLGNVTHSTEYPEQREGSLQIEGTNAILTIELVANVEGGVANLSLDIGKNGVEDVTGEMTQDQFYAD